MLVAVGGHSRNIGKTSVVAGLIRALPQWNWTAMKITQFGHGVCSISGKGCACCLQPEHAYAISEELAPGPTDSGRFLAAGARSSYWVRTAMGQLAGALPAIRKVAAASENVIMESNSIVPYLAPCDLYLVLLDGAQPDFKASSLRFLDRADACVVVDRGAREPQWTGVSRELWASKPQFAVSPPQYMTAALSTFVDERLAAACAGSASAAP